MTTAEQASEMTSTDERKILPFPPVLRYRSLEQQEQRAALMKQLLSEEDWELMMARVMEPITRGLR